MFAIIEKMKYEVTLITKTDYYRSFLFHQMSTIIKKICKVCGELRIIEDNKCTHCQSEYDDECMYNI